MMKSIKVSELTGQELNWAVQHAEGLTGILAPVNYFGRWEFGGPIIEREGIELLCNVSAVQAAVFKDANPDWFACLKHKRSDHWHGTTPLIAAMRCYVASKLGDTIDVPEGLL
jgi:hypothetical protein